MTLSIVGFDDLVTSFVATIATGWSDPCRVGLPPTGKPRLNTAHAAIRGTVESTTGAVVADAGEWPLAGSAGASIRVITPFPVAARRTGHVDLPHPALGQGITLSPTEGRASLATDA